MAVYKSSSSSRANGASPPASASASAPAPSQKNEKVKTRKHLTHSHSRKSSRSSAADNLSKFTANQTFTPEYRRQLCQKTLDLAASRTSLNKKLSRASKDKASKNKLKHDKLLNRHQRLEKREKRHLATRTRALVELERKFKLNPTAEREKDLRLIKKLLLTFKRNLKANMGLRKNKPLRPSPSKSDSSRIVGEMGDSLLQDDSVIHDTGISATPEHSDSEEKANGTKRKRGTGQRSTVSLTALFSQEDPEQTPGQTGSHAEEVVQEAVHASKKAKKQKVAEPQASSPVATSSTKSVVNGKENATVSCSGALPADKPVSPKGDKNGKKHSLPVDGEVKAKSKKAKVEEATAITPATPASPKANFDLPKPKNYHEQRVYDMLTDPLGYDDFVYEDTRPVNKRPKFRRFGYRTPKQDPNFTAVMSGGLSLPESTKAAVKPRSADRLSNSVLKRSHNKKVAETVQDMKSKKNSSSLATLTEKSKYSVNKESRYSKTNGAGKSGTNGSIQQRKNKEHGRQQHLRSQYSTFTCPEVPDLISTMTSATLADDIDEDSCFPETTMTSAILADDVDEDSNYSDPIMTSPLPATDVDEVYSYPDPNMTSSSPILVKPAGHRSTPRHSKVKVFPEPDRAWFKQPRSSGRSHNLQMFSSIPATNSNRNEEQVSRNGHDNNFSYHGATASQVQLSPLSGKSGNESDGHSATGSIEADIPDDGLSLPPLFTSDVSVPDDEVFDINPYLSMLQPQEDANTNVAQVNETDMSDIDPALFDCELVRVIKSSVYIDDNNSIDTNVDTDDNNTTSIGTGPHGYTQQPLLSTQTDTAG